MDKNLSDDMVKLVRYSILTIERDHEHTLKGASHLEEVVTDNLTEDAFASWVIAKYFQNGGEPIGADKKKYLRVPFEVVGRWAKQDREYEKRQLEVLEEIRNAIPASQPSPGGQPFEQVAQRYEANRLRLKYLRQGFQLNAKTLGTDVATSYGQFRDKGEFVAIDILPKDLQVAFAQGSKSPFDPAGMESFIGEWKGTNRRYDFDGKEFPQDASTWHMTWEKGVIKPEEYVQRVVGSKLRHFHSDALPLLSEKKVDLALNVWRPEMGVSGWLSMWVESRNELALISYELQKGRFLWIGQILTEELTPVFDEKVFWMFLEWIDLGDGVPDAKKAYYMYGLQFEIDFETGRAKIFGDSFRKSRFDPAG